MKEVELKFRDMSAAPRDGTIVLLYVAVGRAEEEAFTSFLNSSENYATIGMNDFAHTDVDEWQFAGWSWTHDCFVDGSGTPVGWLPLGASE